MQALLVGLANLVATVLVGFTVVIATWKLMSRQNDIQAFLAGIEGERRAEEVDAGRRAAVTARFEAGSDRHGHRRWKLVIENAGPATATDVFFELLTPPKQGPRIDGVPHPISSLVPGQPLEFVTIAVGEPTAIPALLRWSDGTGTTERRFKLSRLG